MTDRQAVAFSWTKLFYQITVDELREEIQEQSRNSTLKTAALLSTAREMANTMDTILHLLQ